MLLLILHARIPFQSRQAPAASAAVVGSALGVFAPIVT